MAFAREEVFIKINQNGEFAHNIKKATIKAAPMIVKQIKIPFFQKVVLSVGTDHVEQQNHLRKTIYIPFLK